jgi:signal transduction histidine kinase
LISDLKYPLYFRKIQQIKNYLKNSDRYRDVEYFIIYNKYGKILVAPQNFNKSLSAYNFHQNAASLNTNQFAPVIFGKIYFDNKLIGAIAIRFHLQKELERINNRVFWVGVRFLIIALAFISLGLFFFYIITFFITKPLSEIKKNIEKIKDGNYKISFKSSFNDEIGSVINAINLMAYAIEDYIKKIDSINKERYELNCMAVMGEMSANIAHEVKNAIYVISSANTYISNETKNKIIKEFTGIISNEVNRLNRMTVDFLSFARQRNPELKPLDINRLIDDSLKILEFELPNLNIKLIKNLNKNMPFIKGDSELLKQVILNLIVNAIDATCLNRDKAFLAGKELESLKRQKSKIIEISTKAEDGFAVVEVGNNGKPIQKESLADIFKPFFTTKNTGSGLGLPISLRIVKLHGGTINVESAIDKTIFTVKMPLFTV